jgi:hypothetical protein
MKKFGIIALAALLVVAFTVPASALENVFGGYWRTRFITQQNFTGEDKTEAQDSSRVDTRTRLYYTAKINDNLKFVNKFEIDAVWGDTGWGDIGADGVDWQVKNSYVDANIGPLNAKVGVQGITLARGFLFSDDFAGMVLTYKGEGFAIPFVWMKPKEGGAGLNANDMDVDVYALAPSFTLGEGISISPYVAWATTDDWSGWAGANWFVGGAAIPAQTGVDIYYLGLDADMKFGPASVWFTGIYMTGDVDFAATDDVDLDSYLIALGGAFNMGMFDIHGQFFYADGDDPDSNDFETFFFPSQNVNTGQSYYWAEIMGYGVFDEQGIAGFPNSDKIGNIWAANLGTTIKPMDKLTVSFDLWYASLVEDNDPTLDEVLGTEVDLRVTYELVEGLKMDVVGAYLFADDAANFDSPNDANPYELGVQLSLSF